MTLHCISLVAIEIFTLTRRAMTFSNKNYFKGNSVCPPKDNTRQVLGEDRSKALFLGGDRVQSDRQTNRQTDKRCSVYINDSWPNPCTPCVWYCQERVEIEIILYMGRLCRLILLQYLFPIRFCLYLFIIMTFHCKVWLQLKFSRWEHEL